MMNRKATFVLSVVCSTIVFMFGCSEQSMNSQTKTISFNRDIRPILNENCTGCHGGVGKQAGVSFIVREEALGRGHSGRLTVVPGDPDASGLIERIESTDPNLRMPYKGEPLPKEKIALLRLWIKEGAHWEEHWAFEKPKKQTVPKIDNAALPVNNLPINYLPIKNEIDNFVQAKLVEKGLTGSAPADKNTLLRRLSLDLIGMPPTPQELADFLADTSDNAYEKQVDRLLASKHFGERWASMWLDIARYADSRGYTKDQYRPTWPYRDWVINAFNTNKPYSDFIVEQLAGDLLPNRTLENMIATGFHRQTPINNEGGTDDEQFRVVAMLDRVSTTWAALNGITMNCVQCHSHPYDPIFHDEFYKAYSFLNTTQDADKTNDSPTMKIAHKPAQQQQAFQLQEQLLAIKTALAKQAVTTNKGEQWHKLPIVEGEIDELPVLKQKLKAMEKSLTRIKKGTYKYGFTEKKIASFKESIAKLEGQALVPLSLKNGEVYETSEGLAALAIYQLNAQASPALQKGDKTISALRFMVSALNPKTSVHTPEFAYNLDKVLVWHVKKDGTKTALNFSSMIVNTTEVLDNQLGKLNRVHQMRLKENGSVLTPLKVNDGMGAAISLFGQRLFNPRWSVAVLEQPITLAEGESLRVDAFRMQGVNLNGQPSKLRRLKIEATNSSRWSALAQNQTRINNIALFAQLTKQLKAIKGLEMPVMYEQDAWDKRGTALFARGNFLAKEGPLLAPDVPKILSPLPKGQPKNRLTMAKWFFNPEQPLTSRVAVNRFWHALFGLGIVETLEDFGSIGAKPSHPALLDWLALTFQHELNWDMKALIKLIVSSATYQQQANVSAELLEKDPHNKWLARGPHQRLTAEMIRDQALLASGLLSRKMGGMGVMPVQPPKIWGRKGTTIKDWKNAKGEDRYRRAVYTFIKRQYTYPSFVTFDMESREISHARRIPTNTPLQALVTLNDPVYHEASQALAKLMLAELNTSNNVDEAINFGVQRVINRQVNATELATLKSSLTLAYEEVGKDKPLNAWTAIASILLNLDSALTR